MNNTEITLHNTEIQLIPMVGIDFGDGFEIFNEEIVNTMLANIEYRPGYSQKMCSKYGRSEEQLIEILRHALRLIEDSTNE